MPQIVPLPVLYLYEFTLLSNTMSLPLPIRLSYTSMNLHYSQTSVAPLYIYSLSYTSMNLHYSQTVKLSFYVFLASYTSMNLHYSQTLLYVLDANVRSYTSMNLHYSQTENPGGSALK